MPLDVRLPYHLTRKLRGRCAQTSHVRLRTVCSCSLSLTARTWSDLHLASSGAHLRIASGPRAHAETAALAVHKAALELAAVGVVVDAPAVLEVLLPVALVLCTIGVAAHRAAYESEQKHGMFAAASRRRRVEQVKCSKMRLRGRRAAAHVYTPRPCFDRPAHSPLYVPPSACLKFCGRPALPEPEMRYAARCCVTAFVTRNTAAISAPAMPHTLAHHASATVDTSPPSTALRRSARSLGRNLFRNRSLHPGARSGWSAAQKRACTGAWLRCMPHTRARPRLEPVWSSAHQPREPDTRACSTAAMAASPAQATWNPGPDSAQNTMAGAVSQQTSRCTTCSPSTMGTLTTVQTRLMATCRDHTLACCRATWGRNQVTSARARSGGCSRLLTCALRTWASLGCDTVCLRATPAATRPTTCQKEFGRASIAADWAKLRQ